MRRAFILAALVGAGLLGGSLYSKTAAAPPTPLDIIFPEYEPQKVVYHVTAGAGWLGSEHRQRLKVLERVDIHRVQICALTIDSMDMNALGVCS